MYLVKARRSNDGAEVMECELRDFAREVIPVRVKSAVLFSYRRFQAAVAQQTGRAFVERSVEVARRRDRDYKWSLEVAEALKCGESKEAAA